MMIRKIAYLIFACLMLAPLIVLSQNTVTVSPGSEKIKGNFIEPYTNKWQVSLIDTAGSKKVVHIWTDYVQLLMLNNSNYLHRVQDLYDANHQWQETWVNIVEASNLTPLRYTLHRTDGTQTIMQFKNNKLRIQNITDGALSDTTFHLQKQVYDWNLYGMLLVGLLFDIGTTYELPVWSETTATIESLTAIIEGREDIETLTGQKFSTYKIATNKRLVFWLTKTKPYVIQLKLYLPNGSTMIWEMM